MAFESVVRNCLNKAYFMSDQKLAKGWAEAS